MTNRRPACRALADGLLLRPLAPDPRRPDCGVTPVGPLVAVPAMFRPPEGVLAACSCLQLSQLDQRADTKKHHLHSLSPLGCPHAITRPTTGTPMGYGTPTAYPPTGALHD